MKTKYRIIGLVYLIVSFGCNSINSPKSAGDEIENPCKPYFLFDEVEHYYLDMEEDSIWEIEEKTEKTDKEIKQLELLIQYTPDKLADTAYLYELEKIDFVKADIGSNKFEKLRSIFCERKHKESIAMPCTAIYRDILVFKKDNRMIGIAKLCFDCDRYVISGTSLNTSDFGQSGDFQKLYDILH